MTTDVLSEAANTGAPAPVADDARIIAIIGFAHGVSHFFHLLLPPLFPWLMPEFGLSFIEIGATMTVFFVVSGIGQAMAGFAVDRLGALKVLLAGISCFLIAGLGLAFATSANALFVVAAIAGLGNAVFHPADFTVLNRKVSPARLGHAFSMHGLSGNLGWAAAPVFLTGLASLFDWRMAAAGAGLLTLPAMLLLWKYRALLDTDHRNPPEIPSGTPGTFAFLGDRAVWLCFAFFCLITAAFGAFQNYATPVLQNLYGLPLGMAAGALSTYLLAAGGGIIVGGFVAQKQAHEQIIAVMLGIAALLAVVLALNVVPGWGALLLMAGIGFFSGIAGPSRDLLVRRAATARFGQAAYGRIYGFVYAGLDTGLAAAPLIFGGAMDSGQFATVLVGVALLQGAAILTALKVGRGA
ncbi:MAG: MFS transporter [Zoogloeaceae bacterium]|nr:MFS transporter [Zoogloeaceae bacterium]